MKCPLHASLMLGLTIFLTSSGMAADDHSNSPNYPLGGSTFEHWDGLKPLGDGTAEWSLSDKPIAYRVPAGPQGWYSIGLKKENDGTIDLRPWYGLRLDVELPGDDAPFAADLTASLPQDPQRHNLPDSTSAHFQIQGKGWHTVTVPMTSFDYNRGQVGVLKFIQQISLQGHYAGAGHSDHVVLRNVRLVAGDVLHLASAIQSLPAEGDAAVTYPITVTNCSDTPQTVALSLQPSGWEGMSAEVAPSSLILAPGESKTTTLTVKVPNTAPGGSQETQTLVATPLGDNPDPVKMEFITVRRLPHPYLAHTAAGWDDVRTKVAKYPWAKTEADELIKKANDWKVPEVAAATAKSTGGTPYLFATYGVERNLNDCATAWELTGDKKYAEKVALLLRHLSDPATGYPHTFHVTQGDLPQEGGFFENAACAYDEIYDAGVLSDSDKQQVEQTFRLYIGTIEDTMMGDGGISNWSVFNLGPAAECALAVQDMHEFHYLMNGPCGLVDQLRYGMMDDGWWYEMSLSYNLGVAEGFTKLAVAAQPFGIDFLHEQFPAALTSKVGLRPFEFENFLGMAFGKFGPVKDNTVTLKKMWDGITLYPDYRGVMFGMGDGHEQIVAGSAFELAYYAFRDPAYAAIIQRGTKRDLVFGVPELPPDTVKTYLQSGHSDNAGIAVLRSQTTNREPREQIQAVLKYGSHGSYHGHFDRISLDSLMRYGRSFFSPETSWYGYGSYMYKWWVQISMAHNLVVVDGKMQEPKPCRLLLFHSGPMLQAVAAETDARWSNPPYFGGYEQLEKVQSGDAPFVNIPAQHPKIGEVTDYTEPVRQRRLLLVTDDYVVVADDLHCEQEHTFDQLTHLRGAGLADPAQAQLLGHDDQFDGNPLGSGQFITDCNRYALSAPALVHSILRIGGEKRAEDNFAATPGKNWETGGAKSLSEPGVLQIDEHVLWPAKPEVVIGDYAEAWPVDKKLTYDVQVDGKSLAAGTFGAWILGRGEVDIDLTGSKSLQLSTSCTRKGNTLKTLFWGNPVVVTNDGKEIPLAQLKPQLTNVIPSPAPDQDYAGGPVRIAGRPFDHSLAAEPQDVAKPAVITVDLTGLNAVRFKASIGGDWPVGDEEQLRKVVSVRSKGKQARFLTLLEPYEDKPLVKSATATDADHLHVELTDGRAQDIQITGLDGDGDHLSITLAESKDGKATGTETAQP